MDFQFNEQNELQLQDGLVITKDDLKNYAKTIDVRELMSNEYATDTSMQGVTTADILGKNFIYTKKASGGKIYKPKEGDAPELWNEWYKVLDIPVDEKGYEDIQNIENLPKEFEPTLEQDRKDFVKYCNDHKISKKSAEKMLQYIQNKSSDALNTLKTRNESQITANREALQKEWGDGYEGNVKFINGVVGSIDTDGSFTKWAEEKGLKTDPALLKFIYNSSQHLKEDHLKDHDLMKSNNTPVDYLIKMNELTNDFISGKYQKGTPLYEAKIAERKRLATKIMELGIK